MSVGPHIGVSIGRKRRRRASAPPIITATSAPTLGALTDAQTPADGYTPGSYESTAGTIASAVATYLVNGIEAASDTDLASDDTVQLSVLVTDSVGNTRTFSTGTVTVSIATSAPGVTASDALAGRTLTITVDSLTGYPEPDVALSALTLDGEDVLADATGTGPWTYAVPSSASDQDVAWTVIASNGVSPDATASGGGTVSADLAAPAFTTQPSISPSSGEPGDTFTISEGVATGSPSPTLEITAFTLDGVDKLGELSGLTWDSNGEADGTISVTVTADNGVGSPATATATAEVAMAGELAPIQTVTSWDFGDGVVLTFDGPTDVVEYENGLHVMTASAGSVTGWTPVSEDIDSLGYVGNGVMVNPFSDDPVSATDDQGWDEMIATYPGTDSSVFIPYDASLNKHPSIAGPLAWGVGDEFTAVQCIRRSGITDPTNEAASGGRAIPDRFVYVTFGPTQPLVNSFRPPASATDKSVIVTRADIDVTRLPNLPAYTGLASQATAESYNVVDAMFGWGGEAWQRIGLYEQSPIGTSYGAQVGVKLADIHHRLVADVSEADKLALIDVVIQRAIDFVGIYQRGNPWNSGAGQFSGTHLDLMVAYCVTQKQVFLDCARAMQSGTFTSARIFTEEDIGLSVPFPSSSGTGTIYHQTGLEEHLGQAIWTQGNATDWYLGWDSGPSSRYQYVISGAAIAEQIIALVLDCGGTEAWELLGTGAHPLASRHSATTQWARKLVSRDYGFHTGEQTQARHMTAWNDWLTYSTYVHPDEPPEQLDLTWPGDTPFTSSIRASAGAGSITIDLADFSAGLYSVDPVTQVDYRISLDQGIQWVEFANLGYIPTISEVATGVPLTRASHYVGWRLQNANGAGPWSPSFPYAGAGGARVPRIDVMPTGTPSNSAPTYIVTPATMVDKYPLWGGVITEAAPAVLDSDFLSANRKIYAGAGYPTGYPAPTMTFQWKRDGVSISGATTNEYTPSPVDDAGTDLTCTVTATNGVGSPAVHTTTAVAVGIPAAPASFSRVDNQGAAYLTRSGIAGAAEGKTGTFALSGKLLAGDGTTRRLLTLGAGNSGDRVVVQISTANKLQVALKDNAGANNLNVLSSSDFNVAKGDFNVLVTWNLVAATVNIYTNGVSDLGTTTTLVDANVDYDWASTFRVFSSNGSTLMPDVEVDYVYLSPDYVTPSAPNLAKLASAPDMGYFGEGLSGNRPYLYLRGPASAVTNYGSGGAFTQSGTFVNV